MHQKLIFIIINITKKVPRTQGNCICNEFVDENGNGACKNRDSEFDNLYTCYVDRESTCKDMHVSKLHPNMSFSAEACEDKNECMIM